MAEKIPYLRNTFKSSFAIIKEWKYFEGDQGCLPVVLDGMCLRFDQSPPKLPQPAHSEKKESAEKAASTKTAEPFDLYELPIGMRAEGFEVGEKFARRWLNGRAYTAFAKDLNTGRMLEGMYDADMVDADTVKLSWLLAFGDIRSKYDALLIAASNPSAQKAIARNFNKFLEHHPTYSGTLDTLQ